MTTRENDITESFTGDRMSTLNEIAARTKERIAEEKFKVPLRELISQQNSNLAKHAEEKISFLEALKKPGMSYICEVKKASPSKGLIAPDFPYLQEISQAVNIPVLRKDFTVDEYMIYQAKAFGASAVLLICAILDNSQLKAFGELAQELGLDALVEAHDQWEVDRALKLGAKIVGVNNRNLHDFTVDMGNSIRLRNMAPADTVFVSESGIKTAEDIRILYENQVDAVLIGETLMRSPDKKAALGALNAGIV